MNDLAINRTPHLIAAEINSIKEQTRKMLIFNSIEIGNRLIEAKAMIEHGQWGKWLEDSVDYSQSTANNLMRIAEEYGSKQMVLFGSNAKSQALGKLSYTQAVALLGIPADEREQFVEHHDLENMSTRELQQAIKERQELEDKVKRSESNLRVAESGWEGARQEVDELKKKLAETKAQEKEIQKQLTEAKLQGNGEREQRLQSALVETDVKLKESQKRIVELEQQLKAPVEPVVVTKVPDEVERELQELRAKAVAGQSVDVAEIKYRVCFQSLVKGFGDLLGALNEINNPEAHDKYKGAIRQLIDKMAERL